MRLVSILRKRPTHYGLILGRALHPNGFGEAATTDQTLGDINALGALFAGLKGVTNSFGSP
jgi:hypothetical protein